MNMAENVGNNQHNQHNQHNNQHDQYNRNVVNNIPQPPIVEGLYRMVRQLHDQNRKLSAQMAVINRENSRRENGDNRCQNNNDLTGDKEENNTHNTRGRKETFQTTTTQGLPIYLGPLSEFIMLVALQENF